MKLRCRSLGAVALLTGAGLVACSAPPPAELPEPPVASAGPVAPVVPALDLSPVPAPAGVVVKARLKSFAPALKVAASVSGLPQDKLDEGARRMVARGIGGRQSLRLDVDLEKLAAEIVLDAPVDLVVTLPEGMSNEPGVAFAVGLRSLEAVRTAAGDSVSEAGPGAYKLGGKKARGVCVAAASSGPSPARLVCGPTERDVLALAPYFARTLSVEPSSAADLHATIDIAAIDAKFGSTLRSLAKSLPLITRQYAMGEPTFDKALEDGMRFVATEGLLALSDHESITLDARIGPQGDVSFDATAVLKSDKSWFAKMALAAPSGPAPAILFEGPADAASGGYGVIADPAAYGDVVAVLKGLFTGALASEKIGSDAERKKLAAIFDVPLGKNATIAIFTGDGRLTPGAEPKTPKEKWQRGFEGLGGYVLVGSNQRADALSKWLKDAVSAVNQPGIQSAIKRESGGDVVMTLKSTAAPAKLGAGSAAFELRVAGTKKDKAELTYHLLLAPDGDGSWLAGGFDPADLTERLLRAKAGTDSLAGRSDLASLKQDTLAGGGFMGVRALRSGGFGWLMLRQPTSGSAKPEDELLTATKKLDQVFDGLPAKGRSPVFFRSKTTRGARSEVVLGATVPKATLDEIGALVRALRDR